jgi:hypothetical protein
VVKVPRDVAMQFGGVAKFRAFHRSELSKALRVLDSARRGCAYAPGYHDIVDAIAKLERARNAASVKNWEKRK